MTTNKKIAERRMDWHLVWTALGVVIPVIACVIGYGMSMNRNILSIEKSLNEKISVVERNLNDKISDIDKRMSAIDKRLVVIETVIIMSGHDIKGIALNKNDQVKEEALEKK